MARMLRKGASHAFGCCDRCARKQPAGRKPDKRERRLARAREKKVLRQDLRKEAW